MNESDDEETEDSGRNDDNQIENPDPEDEGFEVYDSEGDDLEHTETTPQRSLSDITNTMNSERSRSKKSKVIRREQSKNLRSLTWRRQVDNNFKAINKNLQKLSRNNNLGSHRQSSEKPVNSTSEIPELVEKVTVEDDVEFTEIDGIRFDPEQYASVLMAGTMQARAGRVMNVVWTREQMKKLYLSQAKVQGEFSQVTQQEISKIKRLCKYLQKKNPISLTSRDDIDKCIKKWISDKLREVKRGPRNQRRSQD
ncbi:uncharacterized protein LOC123273830 [Cotesia glomerata]|nr:uncharacterized protein LOC123273830 [Cotesia glomerata]